MKTYVLMVSKKYPKKHQKAGQSTYFVENISKLPIGNSNKIHTIRSNYELWKRRAVNMNNGEARLSIRYWEGMPYKSKQKEILSLIKIGVEKLENPDNLEYALIDGVEVDWLKVAKNDGLSFNDFNDWFYERQKKPMAIIHFTNFRYTKSLKLQE